MFLIANATKGAKLYFVDRRPVNWGGYSMIQAEMELLQEATSHGYHAYYHLLSGCDLPLKTQDQIHSFYEANQGKEFVHFAESAWIRKVKCRLQYYWLFQNIVGHSRRVDKAMLKILDRICVRTQKLMGVDRMRNLLFSAGSQWFSITDDFARCIVSQEAKIEKTFKYSLCGDECLIQMMAVNSNFFERVYDKGHYDNPQCTKRYIIRNGRDVYVFRLDDYDLLMSSDCLFARKFDENVDRRIIDKIYETILK